MNLTKDEIDALIAALDAIDGMSGVWPRIEAAITEAGIEDAEGVWTSIGDKLRNG